MTTRRNLFMTALAAPLASGAGQLEQRKARLKQCATRSCFGRRVSLEDAAREGARLGLKGIDLIAPADWPILKKYGLLSTMAPAAGHSLTDGINTRANHAKAEPAVRELINQAAAFGCPNVIVLSGNRRGMSDEEGIANCALFLNNLKTQTEDKGVNVCLELLNSKVDHPDYQCDHTAWGVQVMKRVNSPRVKLLYDIYHMQIMEGDVIRTIRDNIRYIGHFHTAGVPGRHEIDEDQELNYQPIAKAIVEAGFSGYLAHEYSPTRDALKSLDQALEICDV